VNGSQTWIEKDFYKTLGVDEKASEDQIRRAYRKLAQKHHPDRNPGDKNAEERMKDIAEAYDVLSDSKKRQEYDQIRRFGAAGPGGPGGGFGFGGPGGSWSGTVNVDDLGGFGDLFSSIFGGGRRGARQRARGEDVNGEAHLSFDDAMRGATISVSVPHQAACATCGGSGAKPGSNVTTCSACGGHGVIEEDQGVFSIPRTCPTCGGRGRIIEQACETCRGDGRVTRTDPVRVRVPAGVKGGARIRVRGRGNNGGDLYVTIHVAPHRVFGRSGDDLTVQLPLTFTEAALGAEVRVPTLNGSVTLRVPPGTQNGRTFRIRGKGAPKAKGFGDLLATARVVVPEKLSDAERELLEKFAAEHQHDPRTGLGV
jgi:molecular chaperone DnaJ